MKEGEGVHIIVVGVVGAALEESVSDVKLCTIGEGTSEIQQLVIGRHVLKEY